MPGITRRLLRRANGDLLRLDVGGLPLGIQSNVVYETAELELKPGDALVFFTDGVVEASMKQAKSSETNDGTGPSAIFPIGTPQQTPAALDEASGRIRARNAAVR